MSEIYIYDNSKTRIGILQNEESVQWLENYQSPGEVKIVARVTADNLSMLIEGNRLYNTDSDTVAIIRQVQTVEGEGENSIIVRGVLTAQMLDQRVVMATENITNVEAGMYAIYSKNRRGMSIEPGTAIGYTEIVDTEITWNTVLDAEESLAESSGLGFSVKFDPEAATETLKVYKGVDRTDVNSPDYVGYFGTDVGNIVKVQITSGTENFKNVAVVAGEGEGAARKVRIVSLGNVQGDDRRELYVDARDVQSEYQIATPTGEVDEKGNPTYTYTQGTYTVTEYNALLDTRGVESLAECLKTFEITCDVTQDNMEFGKEYLLGDRMPIKLPEYGIYASAVVASVNQIYENTGKTVALTFNNFELDLEEYRL